MSRATEIRKEIVEISEDYYRLPDESWVLRESMENEVESLMQEYRELPEHKGKAECCSGMLNLLIEFAGEILNDNFSSVEELQYFIYDGRPVKVEVEEFDIDQYIECSVPTRF